MTTTERTVFVTIRWALNRRLVFEADVSPDWLVAEVTEQARQEFGLPELEGGEPIAYSLARKIPGSELVQLPPDMTLEQGGVVNEDVLILGSKIPFANGAR